MNKVIMIGNLTADPELRKTGSDIPVCTFHIAVQRRLPNPQGVREADFFNVVVWRQQAEHCAKYLAKGRKVGIAGYLQSRTYDAKDGSKRTVVEIVADEVDFLSPAERQERQQTAPQEPQFTPVDDDSDLPF